MIYVIIFTIDGSYTKMSSQNSSQNFSKLKIVTGIKNNYAKSTVLIVQPSRLFQNQSDESQDNKSVIENALLTEVKGRNDV